MTLLNTDLNTISANSLALVFAIVWFVWINLSWLSNKKYTVFGLFYKDSLALRLGEWWLRLPVVLLLGYYFDNITYDKPHAAYSLFEFYGTFIVMSAVFSLPGIVYDYRLRQLKKR